ncbi:MAG: prolipoprotein diacylglyceryl transferase [Clostridia bacterium]|nr:prolipoprotein diacylglyceryl transferase [Clostridia bacterium]
MVVLFLYTKKAGMSEDVQDFSFFCTVIAIALGFVCAKFYQAIYDWIDSGFNYFDFENAGITAMGGFIGGALFFILFYFFGGKLIFKGKNKDVPVENFNTILRVAPCCITIAHAFGRIGCAFAGCCHGKFVSKTKVPFTIFNGNTEIVSRADVGYYTPVQLYESLFLFALFAILTILYFKRSNITMHIYLIAYAIWRFIIEIFRTDERGGTLFGMSPSQWQSVVFLLAGVGLLVFYIKAKKPFWLNEKENKS